MHAKLKNPRNVSALHLDYIWSFPIYRAAFAYLSVGPYNLRNCLRRRRRKKSAYGRNDFIRYPLFYSPVESAAISLPHAGNTKLTSRTPLLSKFTRIRRLKALDSNNIEIIRAKCLGISIRQFCTKHERSQFCAVYSWTIAILSNTLSLKFKIKNLLQQKNKSFD